MKAPERTTAEVFPRYIGGAWLPRQIRRGDIFVTGSKTPYELRWRSPLGAEMDTPSRDSHRREIHKPRITEARLSRRLADRTAPQGSRTMCVRTLQRVSQSRRSLSWRS
jgi:hypothetical protein